MVYQIVHWYGKVPPVPEAQFGEMGTHEVVIDDIHEFAKKHGNIILSPPDKTPRIGEWCIVVTDESGRFAHK